MSILTGYLLVCFGVIGGFFLAALLQMSKGDDDKK